MTYENAQLAKEIESLKEKLGEKDKTCDQKVEKVRKEIQDIQSSVASKNNSVKKASIKISKLLTRLTHTVQELTISQPQRNQVMRIVKDIEQNMEPLGGIAPKGPPSAKRGRGTITSPVRSPVREKTAQEAEAVA